MENLTDTLQVKINEARNLLPKESRDAIDNVNWKLTILGMNKKYSQSQLESLVVETELLLCGILTPESYQKELESRLNLTNEGVSSLLREMDNLVFKKIQVELEKILQFELKNIISGAPLILDPQFFSLPKNIQEAISRSNWKENLYKIAEKYKLTVEQMGILEEITIRVMKGEVQPYDYENKLVSRLTISKEDISNLTNEINEKVLKVIRELLKENWDAGEQKEEETGEEMPVPVPPYAKIITNDQLPINNEEKNTQEEPKIETIPKSYKPVEEIVPLPPKNIIEEKLNGTTTSDHTISDYTTPQVSEKISDPVPQSHDPYREPIK